MDYTGKRVRVTLDITDQPKHEQDEDNPNYMSLYTEGGGLYGHLGRGIVDIEVVNRIPEEPTAAWSVVQVIDEGTDETVFVRRPDGFWWPVTGTYAEPSADVWPWSEIIEPRTPGASVEVTVLRG